MVIVLFEDYWQRYKEIVFLPKNEEVLRRDAGITVHTFKIGHLKSRHIL